MSSMPVVLATGGYDQKIRFWDATNGVCIRALPFGDQYAGQQQQQQSSSNQNLSHVNCLQISRDKSMIAGGGYGIIQVFDVHQVQTSNEERPIISYDMHSSNVMAVGFQRDGKWVYSCSEDGTVRILDIRSPVCSRKYDCGCSVNAVALSPNQLELISGDQNGFVKIWDLEADKCREEFVPAVDIPVRSISIAHDNSSVAVGSHKGKLFSYTPNATKGLDLAKEIQAHDDYLLKCLISPDLKSIATSSSDKSVKLWNSTTWELEQTLSKHQRWVWDCLFSADSRYLLTASSDQSAKLWDIKPAEVIRNYVGHNLAVTCVALNDYSIE